MPSRQRAQKPKPQEPLKDADQPEQQRLNVPLLAERLLPWVGLSKLSLRDLAPQDFQTALERMRVHFLSLPFQAAWASDEYRAVIPVLDKRGMMRLPTAADLAAVPLPTDDTERFVAQQLGAITVEKVQAAWPAIDNQLKLWCGMARIPLPPQRPPVLLSSRNNNPMIGAWSGTHRH